MEEAYLLVDHTPPHAGHDKSAREDVWLRDGMCEISGGECFREFVHSLRHCQCLARCFCFCWNLALDVEVEEVKHTTSVKLSPSQKYVIVGT